MRTAFLVLVLLAMGCASGPPPARAPRTLQVRQPDPRVAAAAREASAQHYWPRGKPLEHPSLRDGQVVEAPQGAPSLADAERAFLARRFDEAKVAYERAMAECPQCTLPLTGWADAELGRGRDADLPKALQLYERALELNPFDAQLHAFRASALFRLGRASDALKELAEALTLRPGYPFPLILAAKAREGMKLPLRLDAAPLLPNGYLVPEGAPGKFTLTSFQLDFSEGPAWVLYATCKQKQGEGEWTPARESDCLGTALEAYRTTQARGAAQTGTVRLEQHPSAALERLGRAKDQGFLAEFVTYEIESRMRPEVALTLDAAHKARLREYVDRFILVTGR